MGRLVSARDPAPFAPATPRRAGRRLRSGCQILECAVISAATHRARAAANGATIGRQQSREVDARRLCPRRPRQSLMLIDEIHETPDQPVTAACGQGWSTAPDDSIDRPIVGPLREPLEATDARRGRQIGERPTGADAGDGGRAQQKCYPFMDRRRTLGDFRLADVVDRPLQPPRRRLDEYHGRAAQVETAARADLVRDQVRLSEWRYPAAAGRTSVPQAAAMPEAGNPRGEPPGPPKIGNAIIGKTQSAILDPGRTAPARGLAQGQQQRRQRPIRHHHRRYRLGRNARPSAEPGREVLGKPQIEAGPSPFATARRCSQLDSNSSGCGSTAAGQRSPATSWYRSRISIAKPVSRLTADPRAAAHGGGATPGRNPARRSRPG